jgi:hypothetical protein
MYTIANAWLLLALIGLAVLLATQQLTNTTDSVHFVGQARGELLLIFENHIAFLSPWSSWVETLTSLYHPNILRTPSAPALHGWLHSSLSPPNFAELALVAKVLATDRPQDLLRQRVLVQEAHWTGLLSDMLAHVVRSDCLTYAHEEVVCSSADTVAAGILDDEGRDVDFGYGFCWEGGGWQGEESEKGEGQGEHVCVCWGIELDGVVVECEVEISERVKKWWFVGNWAQCRGSRWCCGEVSSSASANARLY